MLLCALTLVTLGCNPKTSNSPELSPSRTKRTQPPTTEFANQEAPDPCSTAARARGHTSTTLLDSLDAIQSPILRAIGARATKTLDLATQVAGGIKYATGQRFDETTTTVTLASLEFKLTSMRLAKASCLDAAQQVVASTESSPDQVRARAITTPNIATITETFGTERARPWAQKDRQAMELVTQTLISNDKTLLYFGADGAIGGNTRVHGVVVIDAATAEALWVFAKSRLVNGRFSKRDLAGSAND